MLALLRYSQVFDEKTQCRINSWINLAKVYCSGADVMLWQIIGYKTCIHE